MATLAVATVLTCCPVALGGAHAPFLASATAPRTAFGGGRGSAARRPAIYACAAGRRRAVGSDADVVERARASLADLPTRQIARELAAAGISTAGLFERDALLARLADVRAARARRSAASGVPLGLARLEDTYGPRDAALLRAWQRLAAWATSLSTRALLHRMVKLGIRGYNPMGPRAELALALATALVAPTPRLAKAIVENDTLDWPRDARPVPRELSARQERLVAEASVRAARALELPADEVFARLLAMGVDADEASAPERLALLLAELRMCKAAIEGPRRQEPAAASSAAAAAAGAGAAAAGARAAAAAAAPDMSGAGPGGDFGLRALLDVARGATAEGLGMNAAELLEAISAAQGGPDAVDDEYGRADPLAPRAVLALRYGAQRAMATACTSGEAGRVAEHALERFQAEGLACLRASTSSVRAELRRRRRLGAESRAGSARARADSDPGARRSAADARSEAALLALQLACERTAAAVLGGRETSAPPRPAGSPVASARHAAGRRPAWRDVSEPSDSEAQQAGSRRARRGRRGRGAAAEEEEEELVEFEDEDDNLGRSDMRALARALAVGSASVARSVASWASAPALTAAGLVLVRTAREAAYWLGGSSERAPIILSAAAALCLAVGPWRAISAVVLFRLAQDARDLATGDRDYERTGAGSSARRARLRSKRASEARRLQQQRARGGEGGAAAAASGGSSAETAPGPRARFGEWWQSVTPF